MATLAPLRPEIKTAYKVVGERQDAGWPSRHPRLIAGLAMLVLAFAIRGFEFGNPLINVDENFYLLVGDRMLNGALPYVDIWDRKPIGIFLLYAAIRLLGGGGIVQYQVVATLFAAGTATIISRIGSRIATPLAGLAAGALYLLLLGVLGGLGGQTPVFYNLFIAAAAVVTLATVLDDAMDAARVRRAGALAMLLVGIAMQIKYSAVFEGIFFGLVLLYQSRRRGRSYAGILIDAMPLVCTALAPTVLALGFYVWRGETQAFIYANFVSVFARSPEPAKVLLHRLRDAWMVLHLPVFCIALSAALWPRSRLRDARVFGFVVAWAGAAVFGYFVFGSYFDHYALPLLVPIAIACAPLFGYRPYRIGILAAGLMLTTAVIANRVIAHDVGRRHGGAPAMRALVAAVQPRMTNALYVFRGDPILYYETDACIPTRYAFPSHLTLQREAAAIGADPLAEIRRIFATQPSVVVDAANDRDPNFNPAALALGRAMIARDYHLVATVRIWKRATFVYQRNVAPAGGARRFPQCARL